MDAVDYPVVTVAPSVSMLWEPADPAAALRKRFGFSQPGAAAAWVGATLGDRWGIAVRDCERVVISAWNAMAWVVTPDDRRLVAKWSAMPRLFRRLTDTSRLAAWLEEWGVPVAAPIPATDGRLRVEMRNDNRSRTMSLLPLPGCRFSLSVLPVIEGELLDVDDPSQVIDAGRMLATVHDALAAYPHRVDGARAARADQLVHNDFRSANILHDRAKITAVLDLEEAVYSTRVADLAKASVLLGTRYRDWGPTNEDVRATFVSAYCDQAPLTTAQQQELTERISALLHEMGWV